MRYPMVWLTGLLMALIVYSRYAGGPIQLQPAEPQTMDSTSVYRVVLCSHAVERPKTWRYRTEDQYIYLRKDSTRQMPGKGDTLLIQGGRIVRHWCVLSPASLVEKPPQWQHLRSRLCQRYEQLGVHGPELGTLEALTLGYREDLDTEVKQAFQTAGAMHVLAVSGLHTGILYKVLLWLLTLGGLCKPMYEERVKRWVLNGVLILLLWGYALLTGMSPSVVRSVVMLTVMLVGEMIYRKGEPFNNLAIAAFVLLLFRPDDLFSIGFQLSFAAVAAILVVKPHNLVTLSIAAQLGTLPLTMHYFGQMSNYFLLTNLLVVPLAEVLVSLALAALTIGWLPGMGWIGWSLQWATWLMNYAVGWVEHLPGSATTILCTWPMAIALYVAFGSGVLALRKSQHWLWGVAAALSVFIVLYFC